MCSEHKVTKPSHSRLPPTPTVSSVLLLQVCEREKIQVILQPPSMHSIEDWQGAAIASTSRLLLPVHSIEYEDKAGKSQYKEFDYSKPEDLLSKLEQLVLAEVAQRSESLEEH